MKINMCIIRMMAFAATMLLFGVGLEAGTITQTVSFVYMSHNSRPFPYNQLDPSLAPLNEVVFEVNANGAQGPFHVTNPTGSTLSFNLFVSATLSTDGGGTSTATTVPTTLGPGASIDISPTLSYSGSAFKTTNLSSYVGTSDIMPSAFFFGSVFSSNPLITIMDDSAFGGPGLFASGTEKVTYAFGDTLGVPEPHSMIMLSLGLAAIAGMRHRSVRAWLIRHRTRDCRPPSRVL